MTKQAWSCSSKGFLDSAQKARLARNDPKNSNSRHQASGAVVNGEVDLVSVGIAAGEGVQAAVEQLFTRVIEDDFEGHGIFGEAQIHGGDLQAEEDLADVLAIDLLIEQSLDGLLDGE